MQKQLTPAASLSTPEGKRDFYRYWDDEPQSWVEKSAPSLPTPLAEINKRLKAIAGVDRYGDPRYRAQWAGTLAETKYWLDQSTGQTHEFVGKKYMQRRVRTVTGYSYFTEDGKRIFVKEEHQVPDDKVRQRETKVMEFGELRWVIEMKFTGEEMIAAGFVPDPNTEFGKRFCIRNGQRYRKPFDPRGEYRLAVKIEEPEYDTIGNIVQTHYRDITLDDVERVKAVWQKAHSESDAAFAARVTEREETMLRIQAQREKDLNSTIISDAADRLEKLPKGRKIYI